MFFIVLTVNIPTTPQETIPSDNERSPEATPNYTEPSILLSAIFTILGVAVLVVIGALYCWKYRGMGKKRITYRMLLYKGIFLKPNTFNLSVYLFISSNSMRFLWDISTR